MSLSYSLNSEINLHVTGRISKADASRQSKTAAAILRRLADQPGVILADEVGMGKTFVAISVAVSVALSNRGGRPVVVMVPSTLKDKWPQDLGLFCERCLPNKIAKRIRFKTAEKAVDFLKLLDDPKDRRCSIIFMTHGAMSRGLNDPWVMLALIQRSLHRRRNTSGLKRALGRFLGDLLQKKDLTRKDEGIWNKLLATPPSNWLPLIKDITGADDDPVPEAIAKLLPQLDTSAVFDALQDIPQRRTKHFDAKLVAARHAIKEQLREVWLDCLVRFRQRLPLLILDEAHHLKNADTRLAKLFRSEDSLADAEAISQGALSGVFERMLFLTATPFQLGHGELCSVLDRFQGIHWTGKSAPSDGLDAFAEARQSLRQSLDRAQEAALCLDHAWGRLTRDDLRVEGKSYEDAQDWWPAARNANGLSGAAEDVVVCFDRAKQSLREAERFLQPWVIRHLKSRELPGEKDLPRRERRVGAAISLKSDDETERPVKEQGLSVTGEALLPFLLACRASSAQPESRPLFAEGLSSSYEAFLHTRMGSGEKSIDDDDDSDTDISDTKQTDWYLNKLDGLIAPSDTGSLAHPKVDATVARSVDIWKRGEKVVVFCHYVQTGRTLRRRISNAVGDEILRLGANKLSCSTDEAAAELSRIGKRFFDDDGPLRRACDRETLQLLTKYPSLRAHEVALVEIIRRNLRTPSFLVRFFPLAEDSEPDQLMQATFNATDESGLAFGTVVKQFFTFLVERCGTDQRDAYINAVKRIQTGAHFGVDSASEYDDDELQGDTAEQLLPNVRLVNGRTRSETRQRLMLTFNTPFYPEILVASSVMSEGVDLHLNCRHIIHHDLCWNPSNLEQRTGRVDRIGAKAERVGQSIQVFIPYIGETQDEKMYRVVMDRERWFNVVMGEEYRVDARSTDKLSERIPFPLIAAQELAFRLEAESATSLGTDSTI
ncbi:ATP-dependent helicase HepA [Rubripirellula obstinata]|uniref:ATP-dependent helicase HepA n=1 Tax=Rubripirellula obstinata TaxID=406547 RepID=A0A5B1CAN9_9BACT|nr:DEAD/DEAH box helicase [Rubripirellula obstinata]KAA1258197.1 ATP-dependent helicase HepA [Rubripirellula obstinata]